jgi:hypothetical protein
MTHGSLTIDVRDHLEPTPAADVKLRVRYTNTGDAPLALTFWWTRNLRVVDDSGRTIAPESGPVAPCGVGEDWTVLAPGESIDRDEPLACTQPAGRSESIGWSYLHVTPGRYPVTLTMRAPPAHGFSQADPDARAFVGDVESKPANVVIAPAKRSLIDRVLGR